ncbi:SRPBCC family protein [Hyella patelloides]|nr:SRPBCC family protein [Hyella patelloides]
MNNSLPLRIALIANAAFSFTCVMLMVFKSSLVGEMLGIQAPLVLQVVGTGLAIFAVDLLHQATKSRIATWRALYASTGDFIWVLATLVLLVLFPNTLSSSGHLLAIAVSVTVLTFGAWQLWAIERTYKLPTNEYRLCVPVYVNAPADEMWNAIGNLGDIKKYAPSLKRSLILDGKTPGVGAVRMCEDYTGKRWSEECVKFENGRSLILRFVSEAPDFPFPVQTMRGGWEIVSGDRETQIIVWWELMPKPKYLAPIILPLLAFQADRDLPKIIQNMAADVLGNTSKSISQETLRAIAYILPQFC